MALLGGIVRRGSGGGVLDGNESSPMHSESYVEGWTILHFTSNPSNPNPASKLQVKEGVMAKKSVPRPIQQFLAAESALPDI
jgi:hypothetical protein